MAYQPNPNEQAKSTVKKGRTGDYVVQKHVREQNLLRFPNRFIVQELPDNFDAIAIVNPSKLEQLELFNDDFVLIKGRFQKETRVIIQQDQKIDPTIIKMNKTVMKNANVNNGDVVSVHACTDLQKANKIKILPFDDDVPEIMAVVRAKEAEKEKKEADKNAKKDGQNNQQQQQNQNNAQPAAPQQPTTDIFDTHLRPYFKDKFRPVTQGDIITIKGTDNRIIDFKVVLLDPAPGAIVQQGTEIFNEGDPVSREEDEKLRKELVGYSDLGGLDKEIQQIRETVELPLKHPELFDTVGIKPPKGILLHGPPGCGKTTIGRAIANETGAFFLLINGPEIVSAMAGESEKNLRAAFEKADEEAKSRGCAIIFIDEIDVIGGKREDSKGEVEKRVVSQLLTLMDGIKPRSNVLVIAATNRPNTLDPSLRRFGRFDREICINVPDAEGRVQILKIKTRKMKLADDVDFDWIAENTNGFVGSDIAQLCTEAGMLCIREASGNIDLDEEKLPDGLLGGLKVTMAHFKAALGTVNPSTLRDSYVEIPKTTWDDIGGLEDVKRSMKELIQYPIQYADQYDRLGIDASHGTLLFGPPGNGKTLLAKAVANECQSNFISVKGPELMSMWVGESERGVRQVFDKARQAQPCVLFLDELDSIARARGGGSGGGEGVNDRMVNQLLTEIDGVGAKKKVFVIGATNRPDTLDPALTRGGRLDQMIYIGMPDLVARESILKASLRKSKYADDVDLRQVAMVTEGYSGADLAEICQKTVQMSIRDAVSRFNQRMSAINLKKEIAEKNDKPLDQAEIDKETEDAEKEFGNGVLQKQDFERAVRQSRASVSQNDLRQYESFKQKFCDAQSGGDSTNPIVANFKFGPKGGQPSQASAISKAEADAKGQVFPNAKGKTPESAHKKQAKDDDFF